MKNEEPKAERIPAEERRRILKILGGLSAMPVVTALFAGSRDVWASS